MIRSRRSVVLVEDGIERLADRGALDLELALAPGRRAQLGRDLHRDRHRRGIYLFRAARGLRRHAPRDARLERLDRRLDLVHREALAHRVERLQALAGDAPRRRARRRRSSPRSASFASTAVVTPPAVSVKIPVVSASRRMPARISSSVTDSTDPAGAAAPARARRGRRRDCRSRGSWRSCPGAAACRRPSPRRTPCATGLQPVGLGAVERRQLALDQAQLEPLARSPCRSS